MNTKAEATLLEIEGSQTALRNSIDLSKKLSAQIDRLLKRHRKEREEGD